MVGTIIGKTKRKAKRHVACKNQRREIITPSYGRKLFHPHPL
jgi:hypothetical protein